MITNTLTAQQQYLATIPHKDLTNIHFGKVRNTWNSMPCLDAVMYNDESRKYI
jgi:hypothetical protein